MVLLTRTVGAPEMVEQTFPACGRLPGLRVELSRRGLRVHLLSSSPDHVVLTAPVWDAVLLLRVSEVSYTVSGAT